MATQKYMKYYTWDTILPFEEDMRTEFKGHRNLVRDEVPSWAKEQNSEKATRKHISRNLNAFLNSGKGGTVYLGVMDDGKVHGFSMTCFQRDHFLRTIEDMFSKYKPQVQPHHYSVYFTPVVNPEWSHSEIRSLLEYIESEELDEAGKYKVHILNSPNLCWCDKEATSLYNAGKTTHSFVIEVTVKAWDPYDLRNPTDGQHDRLRIQPYYEDDEGKVFFRQQASCVQYTLHSIVQTTKVDVKELYEKEIERLKKKIQRREENLRKHHI